MDPSVALLEQAVQATPDNTAERTEALNELAKALWRCSRNSDEETLRAAITTIRQAVEMSRTNRIPKLAGYLNNLGLFLMDLGSLSGRAECAEQAVSVLREGSVCATAPLRPILLSTLGNSLRNLREFQQDADVLGEAFSVYQAALDAGPSPSTRFKILNGLAACHLDRFRSDPAGGNPEDLQRAADLAGETVESSDDNDSSRAVFLDTYAVVLETLFTHYPSKETLEEAIVHYYMAVKLASQQQSPKALQLIINLVDALRIHHRIENTGTSLDDGLSMLGPALRELPATPSVLTYGKWCFSICLVYRFVRDGNERDIEESIDTLTAISAQTPEDSIRGIQYRTTLAEALIAHFDRSSAIDHLDRAVDVLKQTAAAVDRVEAGIAQSAVGNVYINLSTALLARFEFRGSREDLNSALAAAKEALEMLDASSIDYGLALVTCANSLLRAYQEIEEASFLDNAIELYQEAVDIECVWDSFRPGRLYALSYALQLRFGRHGEEKDWERCLSASKQSVQLTENQPGRFLSVGQLGNAYLAKASSEGSTSQQYAVHLQQAASYFDEALQIMPENHSYTALWLNNLGLAYEELHKHQGGDEFNQQALSTYREAADLESAPSLQRVTAAYRAMSLLATRPEVDLRRVADFSRLAVQLLPGLSPRLLRKQDQQEMISTFSGLGSYATSALLAVGESPAEAVRALEASRGVMNSMLIDTRTDVSYLEKRDGHLAAEFRRVSKILDNATGNQAIALAEGGLRNRDAEARIMAAKDFDRIVEEIRQLDGLHNFLKTPTDEEIQFTAGPSSYIILINISSLRSDALVVEPTRIWSIKLPALVIGETVSNANRLTQVIQDEGSGAIDRLEANENMRDILAWLWKSVVNPVVQRLPALPDGSQHRICWIPANTMTNLPIHAATDPDTGSNAMDTIISSYATTIKSLRHSQDHLAFIQHQSTDSALLLAMQQTPAESDLPFALDEISAISALLSPILPVTVLTNPPTASAPTLVTKPTFLSHLTSPMAPISILHLSCHGIASDSDPSQSRLLLPDSQTSSDSDPPGPGPLTVSDIASHYLPSARLAYLSACHVANTKTAWLLDEGLHLAAAFQLAGFPQVVGTLWQISDRRAGRVAAGMWQGVLQPSDGGPGGICYEKVAEAVNVAVRRLRDETRGAVGGRDEVDEDDDDDVDMELEDEPFLWAGFIYMGL
ncbi:CHAT domain-containing protein [Schizothecium vesticola]|uniref:CHAT domain-containing protein n=1 Tax=Schizothecium vesticola TaxID=314040 RepID=A0AA40EX64_9PEZI|nr:CHAT domain-containing protein [Schizothecium vesticola]